MSGPEDDLLGPSTALIHLGYDPATANGALTPPIYMTATYAFESVDAGAAIFRGETQGYVYGRRHNPTQSLLEERLAHLEQGEAALAMASGIACITTPLWTILQAGDHVVIDHTLYGNSYAFFTRALPKFGVGVDKVDMTNLAALECGLRSDTRVVYFETPANPNLRVLDIEAIASCTRRIAPRALVIVDNTFCTPIIQQPLRHGADVVVHSATKFLSGHGDLLGGVVVGSKEFIAQVRNEGLRYMTGATLSPMNAYLILRGLKTLELRMAHHSRSALAVAEFLQQHSSVERVSYPGLPSHPQFSVASKQMSAPGGLISFELVRGLEAGKKFMDRLKLITLAVSLGDAESLVQHPASMTHANYTPAERHSQGIGEGLIRLSVGLENTSDILHDIDSALRNL